MSEFSKTMFAVCVVIGAQPMTGTAVADANANRAAAADAAAPLSNDNGAEGKGRAAEKRSGADGHNLRCWQYGRLIFEEAIAAIPPEVTSEGWAFRGKGDQKASVYLVDTKSGATCLVK